MIDNSHERLGERSTIISYDTAALDYASYYLVGWQQLAEQSLIALEHWPIPSDHTLTESLAGHRAISLFKCIRGEDSFLFCIDAYDDSAYFHPAALQTCRYYFKVNWTARNILRHANLGGARIRPVKPCFALRLPLKRQAMMQGWHHLFSGQKKRRLAAHGLRYWLKNRSLSWYVRRRDTAKRWDLQLAVPYYHDQHSDCNERRLKIIERLKQHSPEITGPIGFYTKNGRELPRQYRRYELPLTSKATHLSQGAAARVSIYVRGVRDCISFKFGEQLALGAAVLGESLPSAGFRLVRNGPLRTQFDYDAPQDLCEAVRMLLSDEISRKRLAALGATIFDEQLTPIATVSDVLHTISYVRNDSGKNSENRNQTLETRAPKSDKPERQG